MNNIPNKFDSYWIHANQWIRSRVPPMRCKRREFIDFDLTRVGMIISGTFIHGIIWWWWLTSEHKCRRFRTTSTD